MANLVSSSFFVRDINIPNLGSASSAVENNTLTKLNSYITAYEAECLKNILGRKLYASYLTDKTTNRMVNLINGVDYGDSHWDGLVHDTDQSLIAYFIYFKWWYIDAIKPTSKGAKKSDVDGGQSVNPSDIIVDTWNSFSRQCDELYDFLINQNSIYPEFTSDVYRAANDFSYPINVFGI